MAATLASTQRNGIKYRVSISWLSYDISFECAFKGCIEVFKSWQNRSFAVQVCDFANNRLGSGSGTAGSLNLDFLTPSTNWQFESAGATNLIFCIKKHRDFPCKALLETGSLMMSWRIQLQLWDSKKTHIRNSRFYIFLAIFDTRPTLVSDQN
jgi:hypothetical protein